MSTVYRKSRREFFKIEQNRTVTRVMNKLKRSLVDIIVDENVWNEVLIDNEPSTESEFNTAYKEAMERITTGKL